MALEVFHYQAANNPLYAQYLSLRNINPHSVTLQSDIPFLPISLFKKHLLQTNTWTPETIFESSTTTGQVPSRHAVRYLDSYTQQARDTFEQTYGTVESRCILALLPSYLERAHSSLVCMVADWIKRSNYPDSGFFLDDYGELNRRLRRCLENNTPTLLLGVSFALLDFAQAHPQPLAPIVIMETGGMKGRRREITRQELHDTLRTAFQVDTIHAEYGMTELLSQAYSGRSPRFVPANTLKAETREVTDPFCPCDFGRTGVLNFSDLANLDTLSFIATEDLGRVYQDGTFDVIGRLDTAEIRGCNLMVES
jgi:hypothetical protein